MLFCFWNIPLRPWWWFAVRMCSDLKNDAGRLIEIHHLLDNRLEQLSVAYEWQTEPDDIRYTFFWARTSWITFECFEIIRKLTLIINPIPQRDIQTVVAAALCSHLIHITWTQTTLYCTEFIFIMFLLIVDCDFLSVLFNISRTLNASHPFAMQKLQLTTRQTRKNDYRQRNITHLFLGKNSSRICGRIRSWPCLWDKTPPAHHHHDECQCQCRAHVDDICQSQRHTFQWSKASGLKIPLRHSINYVNST